MNVIKDNNNKIIKLESFWRSSLKSKTKDINNQLYPYPKEGKLWTDKEQFLDKLKIVNKFLEGAKKFIKIKDKLEHKNCLLCDEKNITKGYFLENNILWEEGLYHYIETHNIKPTYDFIDFIYQFNYHKKKSKRVLKLSSRTYIVDDIKYLKVEKNQLLILDALMEHGGYTKKYIGKESKYSEHAGLLDFNNTGLEKVIISGKTNRVDKGDDDIFLPSNMPDAFDYEYIFHTHPPTPKPGGRAIYGILYEFPSISDIFHFIDHFNMGLTQGSLVICPEGMYNIRKYKFDRSKIKINENKLYKLLLKMYEDVQEQAIDKYGTDFTTYVFYSKIANDMTFIDKINILLHEYNLHIDFFPRIKEKNRWIIDTLYLPVYVTEPV